ncbi:MAG: hypothetical protein H6810_06475 [Phycisphaeraceae bacterium]|nr:MAG: hypothetical protein H6810_06475 [Phycisphaeraceae bacterium]
MNKAPGQIPALPKLLVLLASAVALAGSFAGAGISAFVTPQIVWAALGFTLIGGVAAVLGVLCGLGRFANGYGMAAVCIGGTIAVAAGFAMLDLKPNLTNSASVGRLLKPWAGIEALCGACIIAGGALAVLARRPAAWGLVAKSMACLVPAGVLFGGAYLGWGAIPKEHTGRVIALAILLFGGGVIAILVSIGGHLLIRAFEFTAEGPNDTKHTPNSG